MPLKRPFLLYLRSRLNLGVSAGAAGLLALVLAFLRPHALVPALAVAAAWVIVTGLLFFSRTGAHEVVEENEEELAKKVRAKIEAVSAVRERVAVLRIGDEKMAKSIELFLLESGTYLEKCRELSTYSPVANERIQRVMEICQVFLGEKDESSTARRYQVPAAGSDQATGLADDIRECAAVIHSRITEDLVGTSERDRLSIMKELESDQ